MKLELEKLDGDSLNKENVLKLLNIGSILVKYRDGNSFVPLIHNCNGFALLYHEEGKMIVFAANYDNLVQNYEVK